MGGISPESLGGYHRNINSKPENVRIENGILKWSATNQAKSVVYYFNDLNKEGRVYSITRENSIPVSSSGYYCVSTLNSDNMESEPSELVQKKWLDYLCRQMGFFQDPRSHDSMIWEILYFDDENIANIGGVLAGKVFLTHLVTCEILHSQMNNIFVVLAVYRIHFLHQ